MTIEHSFVRNTDGLIAAVGHDAEIDLAHSTVIGGTIAVGTGATLAIEHGTTTLTGVDVENCGNLQIDDQTVTATLVLDGDTTISGGTITVGSTGELTLDGASLDGVTLDDYGTLDITGPLTLDGTNTITLESGGTLDDTGAIDVTGGTTTFVGGSLRTVDIGTNITVELNGTAVQTADFTGTGGTLALDVPADAPGVIEGLIAGDTIDLQGIAVTTAVERHHANGDRIQRPDSAL